MPGPLLISMLAATRLIPLVALPLLQGCGFFTTAKPERQGRTGLEVPSQWAGGAQENEGVVVESWLRTFEDPQMEQQVAEAIAGNRDLRVTAIRLKVAQESTILARAARLPTASAFVSGSRNESRVPDGSGGLTSWEHDESYRLSLSLSWEIDLWGRLRNLHRASVEDYEATAADYRGARLSLAASTARAWCNLITATQQVELARQTRDSFQRNYRITERNYKAGDPAASPLSVQFGRNNVASAERGLISRQLSLSEAKRALEVLLGRYPSATIEGRDVLPSLVAAVPTGLPSDLLMRRPDLVAAAADLRASAERADAARKNLLPSIRLSAGGSSASEELFEVIADPASIVWNVASSISQPVFEGDALNALARQARLRNDVAVQSFASIALRAFREVESALAIEQSLTAQEEFLETELAQATLAEAQASRDYSEGIVGILSVLESQRRAFSARNAMISLHNQRLQNRIDLYLALGGDFDTAPGDEPGDRLAKAPPRLRTMYPSRPR